MRPLPFRCPKLRCTDLKVTAGINAIQLAIAAVSAWLPNGGLRIVRDACPNLLAETALYRYADEGAGPSENPLDEHNHALAALRYLVSRIEQRPMARRPAPVASSSASEEEPREAARILAAGKLREQQERRMWVHPWCWTSWR
jgi:hypothetical protein